MGAGFHIHPRPPQVGQSRSAAVIDGAALKVFLELVSLDVAHGPIVVPDEPAINSRCIEVALRRGLAELGPQ